MKYQYNVKVFLIKQIADESSWSEFEIFTIFTKSVSDGVWQYMTVTLSDAKWR